MRLPTTDTPSTGASVLRGAAGSSATVQSTPRSRACDALPRRSAPTVGSPSRRAVTWSTRAWLWRDVSVEDPDRLVRPAEFQEGDRGVEAVAVLVRLGAQSLAERATDSYEETASRTLPAGRSPVTRFVIRRAASAPTSPAATRVRAMTRAKGSRGRIAEPIDCTVTPAATHPTSSPSTTTGAIVRTEGPSVPANSSVRVSGDAGIVPR